LISKKLYDQLDHLTKEVRDYIKNTYGEHYAGNIQTIDFIEALGNLQTTSRDKAIKYLSRYGKKNGNNRKDLLKAIHYILFILEADREQTASK
jgi:hypothetical protein